MVLAGSPVDNMFVIDQWTGQLSTGAAALNSVSTPFALLTVMATLVQNTSLFSLCQVCHMNVVSYLYA
jgi:hypothetical protein